MLLEELSNVRGGAKLPKLRQLCHGLESIFSLTVPAFLGKKRERPLV